MEGGQPHAGDAWRRLGVISPALRHAGAGHLEAARQRVADGGHPIVEIMIPLTVTRAELALARGWVEDAVADVNKSRRPPLEGRPRRPRPKRDRLQVTIGTMIETPRAALRAAEIAEVADFFSFGTNDLTQMTFGFSRGRCRGPHDGRLPGARPAAAQPLRGGRLRRRRRARAPRHRAGPTTSRASRSASAASTGGTPSRSASSTTPGSTTSAARPSGSRWPAWPRPRPSWPRRSSPAVGGGPQRRGVPRPPGDQVAPQGDEGPDALDHAEGPGPRQEAVGAGQGAAEGEGQDEDPAPPLQGVHPHHEGQGADPVDRDGHRANVGQNRSAPGTDRDSAAVPSRLWGYRTRKWPRSGRPPTSCSSSASTRR